MVARPFSQCRPFSICMLLFILVHSHMPAWYWHTFLCPFACRCFMAVQSLLLCFELAFQQQQHYCLQDITNLRDFFEVNLEMTHPGSPISVFDVEETIVSRGHILPPAMINNCEIRHSLVGEGSALRVRPSLGAAPAEAFIVAPFCPVRRSP